MCRGCLLQRSLVPLGRHLVTNLETTVEEMRFLVCTSIKYVFSAKLLSYLSNYVQCHNLLREQKF